jgi:hypothetical protein
MNRDSQFYLRMLRRMTPEERLLKAFELSEFTKQLFISGLHQRFPGASKEEFEKIMADRLAKCHNRNY